MEKRSCAPPLPETAAEALGALKPEGTLHNLQATYLPQRSDGTLRAFYRQRMHEDVLRWPGLQDLTASVDFTALAEAGAACGLDLMAYDNQSGFLIGAGIEGIYAHLDRLDDRARLRITSQIKQLMLPGEMGERFKVMLLGRGVDEAWLPEGLLGGGQRRMLG